MKKMEYKTRKWHDKCFQCVVCKSLVGSKPFIIPNENDVYCVGCFEEKFANKCTKCKKIMTTGGVTFKNEVKFCFSFLCGFMPGHDFDFYINFWLLLIKVFVNQNVCTEFMCFFKLPAIENAFPQNSHL